VRLSCNILEGYRVRGQLQVRVKCG
jgi:hypothetical protein